MLAYRWLKADPKHKFKHFNPRHYQNKQADKEAKLLPVEFAKRFREPSGESKCVADSLVWSLCVALHNNTFVISGEDENENRVEIYWKISPCFSRAQGKVCERLKKRKTHPALSLRLLESKRYNSLDTLFHDMFSCDNYTDPNASPWNNCKALVENLFLFAMLEKFSLTFFLSPLFFLLLIENHFFFLFLMIYFRTPRKRAALLTRSQKLLVKSALINWAIRRNDEMRKLFSLPMSIHFPH